MEQVKIKLDFFGGLGKYTSAKKRDNIHHSYHDVTIAQNSFLGW